MGVGSLDAALEQAPLGNFGPSSRTAMHAAATAGLLVGHMWSTADASDEATNDVGTEQPGKTGPGFLSRVFDWASSRASSVARILLHVFLFYKKTCNSRRTL